MQPNSLAKFALKREHLYVGKTVVLVAVLAIVSIGAKAADYLAPGAMPRQASPPPPGSGDGVNQLTSGDRGVSSGPPSGMAVSPPQNGTGLRTEFEKAPTHDNYYMDKKDGRGRRLIMQTPPEGGAVNYETKEDLEKYDRIHYPYPPTVPGKAFQKLVPDKDAPDGIRIITTPTKAIEEDTDTTRFDRDKPNRAWAKTEKNEEPLPIVRLFCRKIVILGVVFATVFMSFAAFSVILGHRDSGQRVIGTAAGLMLLLMGYAIFKVVQINAWRYFEGGLYDWTDPSVENKKQQLQKANTPVVPAEPGGQRRSNLPVRPLGGPQFH